MSTFRWVYSFHSVLLCDTFKSHFGWSHILVVWLRTCFLGSNQDQNETKFKGANPTRVKITQRLPSFLILYHILDCCKCQLNIMYYSYILIVAKCWSGYHAGCLSITKRCITSCFVSCHMSQHKRHAANGKKHFSKYSLFSSLGETLTLGCPSIKPSENSHFDCPDTQDPLQIPYRFRARSIKNHGWNSREVTKPHCSIDSPLCHKAEILCGLRIPSPVNGYLRLFFRSI